MLCIENKANKYGTNFVFGQQICVSIVFLSAKFSMVLVKMLQVSNLNDVVVVIKQDMVYIYMCIYIATYVHNYVHSYSCGGL